MPNGSEVFLKHRWQRIVPLYWLLTTAKIILLLTTAGFALHSALTPATVAGSYLFLPAKDLDGKIEPLIGVGWTLNFEMMFYYVFASALFFRKNVYWFVGSVLFVLAVGSHFRKASWPDAAFYLNSVALEFLFGMLIARWCMKGFDLPRSVALVALPLCVALQLLTPDAILGYSKLLMFGVPTAVLILWSAVSLRAFDRFIPKWVLYLGDASYSIYLIHPFVCPIAPALMNHFHINHAYLSVNRKRGSRGTGWLWGTRGA